LQHRNEPDRADDPERTPPQIGRRGRPLGRALGVEGVQRLAGGGRIGGVDDQGEVAVALIGSTSATVRTSAQSLACVVDAVVLSR